MFSAFSERKRGEGKIEGERERYVGETKGGLCDLKESHGGFGRVSGEGLCCTFNTCLYAAMALSSAAYDSGNRDPFVSQPSQPEGLCDSGTHMERGDLS